MANEEHVEILSQGVEAWNAWRQKNPEVRPDLRGPTVRQTDLNALASFVNDYFRHEFKTEHVSDKVREALWRMDAWNRDSFLKGADLRGADLSGIDLSGANLGGADLRGADLRGTDLSDAFVLDTRLGQANLNQADLRGARRLTQKQIDSANGNGETGLSPGLRRPGHWLEATTGSVEADEEYRRRLLISVSGSEPDRRRRRRPRRRGRLRGPGIVSSADYEIDRILSLLREKIRAAGYTQIDVQRKLNWGRAYVSQLLRKTKSLHIEHLLKILVAIKVPPRDFFAELYGPPQPNSARRVEYEDVEDQNRWFDAHLQGLLQVLVDRGLASPGEIMEAARAADPELSWTSLHEAEPLESKLGPRPRQEGSRQS